MKGCGFSKKTIVGILLLLIFTVLVIINKNYYKPSPELLNIIMIFTTITFSADTLERILNKKIS